MPYGRLKNPMYTEWFIVEKEGILSQIDLTNDETMEKVI